MSFAQLSVGELLEQVAARTPAPGGGAVAAISAALAAALGEMVVHHSRPAGANPQGALGEVASTLALLRSEALALADTDAEAFCVLASLWKLPRDDERRRAGWERAVAAAIEAPSRVMEVADQVLQSLQRVRGDLNPNLRSDLVIAARLAETAAEAAAANVRVNLPLLADQDEAGRLQQRTEKRLAATAELRRYLCT